MQVVPLGGLEEIGKNMTALRQKSGIILVDAGMAFPDEEMPGIDLILPDFSYVRDHAEELKGIVVTHGHEDHVGAIPYLLREFNVPVYATKLTLGLIRAKLKEFGIKKADLREVKGGDKMKLAGFGMEFIEVNHSIPDAVSIALRTAGGACGVQRRLQDRPHAGGRPQDGPGPIRRDRRRGRARLLRRLHQQRAARPHPVGAGGE